MESVPLRVARRLGVSVERWWELDEVTGMVMERLAKAVTASRGGCDLSLEVAGARSIEWAVNDFLRILVRRRAREQLTDPAAMPEPLVHDDGEKPCMRTAAVVGALAGLGRRDRQIVVERALLDRAPEQVAERHGISRGAADTAYSRALARLRRDAQVVA